MAANAGDVEAVSFMSEDDDLMDDDGGEPSPQPKLRSTITGGTKKIKGRGFREELAAERNSRLAGVGFDSIGSDGGPGPHRLGRELSETAARPMLRGIDVNRAPAAEKESKEGAGTSSLNSTISSSGGEMISDEEEGEGSRKKLRLSKDQSGVLEKSFNEHETLNLAQKQALARQLGLRTRHVEVWFQNRRARTKLKQTEVDCEILKQCCKKLTDENQRLRKEAEELRALKLSPQFYMHIPANLKLCPSCGNGGQLNNDATTMPASADQHYLQHSSNQLRSMCRRQRLRWLPQQLGLPVLR